MIIQLVKSKELLLTTHAGLSRRTGICSSGHRSLTILQLRYEKRRRVRTYKGYYYEPIKCGNL